MHSFLRNAMSEISTAPFAPDDEANGPDGLRINIQIEDSPDSRVLAYQLAQAISAGGLLKKRPRPISFRILTESSGPLKLSSDATLTKPTNEPGMVNLELFFAGKSASDVQRDIAHILKEQLKAESEPSPYASTIEGFQSILKAAGLSAKSVEAKGNEIVMTLNEQEHEEAGITRLTVAVNHHIIKKLNPDNLMLRDISDSNETVLRLPLNDQLDKVREGLLNAETELRSANVPGWMERLKISTYSQKSKVQRH